MNRLLTSARFPIAVAVGLLLASIALSVVLPATHPRAHSCPPGACRPTGVVSAAASGQQGHSLPGHDPCAGDPACGGGAALSLGGVLAVTLPVAAWLLAAPRLLGRRWSPAGDGLRAFLLVGGLDHPPRIA